jgi:hypothetical protein
LLNILVRAGYKYRGPFQEISQFDNALNWKRIGVVFHPILPAQCNRFIRTKQRRQINSCSKYN